MADIPEDQRQDPTYVPERGRSTSAVTDAGCPCRGAATGPRSASAPAAAHLPQPAWMAGTPSAEQEDDPGSTLHLYRAALRLRRQLLAGEDLEWRETGRAGRPAVRAGTRGWEVMTNFGATDVPLSGGEVLLSSGPMRHDVLPAETTVWLALG